MKVLLGKNRFYKANLHCHSTKSDGKATVEQLKEEYKKRGYSIVAFTDHEHLLDNSYLNDNEFLAITSFELAIKEFPTQSTLVNYNMRVCHLNFYAKDPKNTLTPCYEPVYDHYITDEIKDQIHFDKEYHRVYSTDGINEIIKMGNEQGFLVAYNHPTWSLENAVDYLGYEGLFAVEIYNHSCCTTGRPDDEHAFDDFLRAGKRIFATCADDNHNGRDFTDEKSDSFGGWVQIDAEKLEYGTIISALERGDFYASTGPEIYSLVQDGDTVTIKTSPCKRIAICTRGRRANSVYAKDGEFVTEAQFTVLERDGYFRIWSEDERGKRAYTQAYDVTE